jgi:hypothetical protein
MVSLSMSSTVNVRTDNTIIQALFSVCTLFGLVVYSAVLHPHLATGSVRHKLSTRYIAILQSPALKVRKVQSLPID